MDRYFQNKRKFVVTRIFRLSSLLFGHLISTLYLSIHHGFFLSVAELSVPHIGFMTWDAGYQSVGLSLPGLQPPSSMFQMPTDPGIPPPNVTNNLVYGYADNIFVLCNDFDW